MKIYRHLLLTVLFCISASSLFAQITEKIVLKDGSVLEGHIVSQVPGDKVKFDLRGGISQLVDVKVVIGASEEKNLNELPEVWKQYLKFHEELIIRNHNDERKVCVRAINFGKDNAVGQDNKNLLLPVIEPGYVVLNDSGYVCSFRFAAHKTFSVPYTQIEEIQYLDGSDKVYDLISTFDNKTYNGQIVSRKIGQYTTLKREGTSYGITIKNSNIKTQKKKSFDTDETMLSQVDYWDVIQADSVYEGLIVEQTIVPEGGSYVRLLSTNGKKEKILNSSIKSIKKVAADPSKLAAPKKEDSKSKEDEVNETSEEK